MSLIVGQELRGCKATYQIIEVLKGASVFKAAIVTNSSEAALSRHSSRLYVFFTAIFLVGSSANLIYIVLS